MLNHAPNIEQTIEPSPEPSLAPTHMPGRPGESGLSMVELLISLAVMLAVLVASVPAFGAWVRDMHVRAAVESLKSGIELARMEAIRRNARVSFRLPGGARPLWEFGCAGGECAAVIQSAPAGETSGASLTAQSSPPSATAPSSVSFNGLGQVDAAGGISTISSIAVRAAGSDRRLVLQISQAGSISVCDPLLPGAECP